MKKLSRRQLPWYALAGFGPNMLNTVITIYLVDALQKTGFVVNSESWTFADKTIISVFLFSILKFIAQCVDGIIDVPFAALTDNLKTRWGKRRPAMLIGLVPMMASYLLFCFPPSLEENSVTNSIYFGLLLLVFYAAYTLAMVTYYGTYSEVTANENDRFYLSNWKAFIDTVQYALAYALIPVFVGMSINIRNIALVLAPLCLTMVLAFALLKERSTRPQDVARYAEVEGEEAQPAEQDVPILESIRLTAKNKDFIAWLVLLAMFFFGLQMFLSGQNVLASGPMGLEGWQIAVINSAAFGPVPLTLWIYRKVMKKKGFRFGFQTALASFAISMLIFSVAYVKWIPSQMIRLIIGATGATVGSYGIGAFLSAPYLVPSQMAADDYEKTGKSHPSMYFAIQGLFTALVGALSTGLVWPNLRNVVYNGNDLFGAHLMPYIATVACIIAIFVAFKLPDSYNKLGRIDTPAQPKDEIKGE